ncbi:MAG: glycosyltransferase family 4 protein [Gemmatimonadota bacterium]
MSSSVVRVLHVITRLDRGGSAENTLLTVARLDRKRFAAWLAVGLTQGERSPTEAEARARGVAFVEVPDLVRPVRPGADLRALVALWRICRRGQFQIVHTHTSKAGLLGRVAVRLARVPVVVHTPHGHVFYGYYGPVATRIFVCTERAAARLCDRIVALTAADAADHVRFGVAPPEHFAVIHSGVDFAPFGAGPLTREEARRGLGIGTGGPVIGTLGRLTAVKGQADLVEAFARLRQRLPEAWLVLVGDGEERAALEGQARSLGVAERVVLPGWRQDVPAALRAMDAFAFPSLNEGMGKALVEAMYAGLPCVATPVGGVPELVEHEVQGLLVPPRNPAALAAALERVLTDAALGERLGRAARERAAHYGADRMVRRIERLYEELLKERGGLAA